MIRDRGAMKWTSMMLPEHVKMLREWKNDHYMKKNERDEQQWEEWNIKLYESMECSLYINISWEINRQEYTKIGKLVKYDHLVGMLHFVGEDAERFSCQVSSVFSVERVE